MREFVEFLRLEQIAGETVEHIAVFNVVAGEPVFDYVAGDFVGDELAGVDIALGNLAYGRVNRQSVDVLIGRMRLT